MGRKQDLETKIRQSQALIQKYEDIIQTSSDPKETARARREIDEQWELIRGWWHEYLSLCQRLSMPVHDGIAQIAARFQELPKAIKQAESTVRVQLILEGDVLSFTEERQTVLKDALAGILRLSADDIRVLKVVGGSVLVVLELPQAAADRLLSLHQSKELVMPGFQVESVKILGKPPTHPKPAPSPMPWQTWLFTVSLVADLVLVFILGWQLVGDNPNLLAYLQIVFGVVGVIVTFLVAYIAVRRPLFADEILYRFGTDRRVQVSIAIVTSLLIISVLSIPETGIPIPTPTATGTPTSTTTPTSTPTLTIPPPTQTSTPTLTPTLTPTPTPDCRGVQVAYLELFPSTERAQREYPDKNDAIDITIEDIDGLQNLFGEAVLTNTNLIDGCTCNWLRKVGDSWEPIDSQIGGCSFLIEVPDQVTVMHLWLTVGGQTKLIVKIQE